MGEKKFGFCVPWTGIKGTPVPFMCDIGKKARDIFGDYILGIFKFEVKAKTDSGVVLSGGTTTTKEGGNVSGNLNARYSVKDYNIGYGCKWTSDSVLSGDLTCSDFCQGANVGLSGSKDFKSDDASLNVKSNFRNELFSIYLEALFKSAKPVVKGKFAFRISNIYAGYSTSFDSDPATFETHNFALGYAIDELAVTLNTENFKTHTLSLYVKATDDLDTAVMVTCNGGEREGCVEVGVGCKYNLDPDCTVRAKVNSSVIIGLSLAQKVLDGVSLNFSTQIDGRNITEGNHTVGFGIGIEA